MNLNLIISNERPNSRTEESTFNSVCHLILGQFPGAHWYQEIPPINDPCAFSVHICNCPLLDFHLILWHLHPFFFTITLPLICKVFLFVYEGIWKDFINRGVVTILASPCKNFQIISLLYNSFFLFIRLSQCLNFRYHQCIKSNFPFFIRTSRLSRLCKLCLIIYVWLSTFWGTHVPLVMQVYGWLKYHCFTQ